MSVLKGKARIVTFRVSGDEYDVLIRESARSGARSLAEFSRTAIFDKVAALRAPRLALNRDLSTLGKALGELDVSLRAASDRITRLLGPVDSDADWDRPVQETKLASMPYTREKG